jgi:hypothetical protein
MKRIYEEEKLQKYRGIDPPDNDEAPNVDEYGMEV